MRAFDVESPLSIKQLKPPSQDPFFTGWSRAIGKRVLEPTRSQPYWIGLDFMILSLTNILDAFTTSNHSLGLHLVSIKATVARRVALHKIGFCVQTKLKRYEYVFMTHKFMLLCWRKYRTFSRWRGNKFRVSGFPKRSPPNWMTVPKCQLSFVSYVSAAQHPVIWILDLHQFQGWMQYFKHVQALFGCQIGRFLGSDLRHGKLGFPTSAILAPSLFIVLRGWDTSLETTRHQKEGQAARSYGNAVLHRSLKS